MSSIKLIFCYASQKNNTVLKEGLFISCYKTLLQNSGLIRTAFLFGSQKAVFLFLV